MSIESVKRFFFLCPLNLSTPLALFQNSRSQKHLQTPSRPLLIQDLIKTVYYPQGHLPPKAIVLYFRFMVYFHPSTSTKGLPSFFFLGISCTPFVSMIPPPSSSSSISLGPCCVFFRFLIYHLKVPPSPPFIYIYFFCIHSPLVYHQLSRNHQTWTCVSYLSTTHIFVFSFCFLVSFFFFCIYNVISAYF